MTEYEHEELMTAEEAISVLERLLENLRPHFLNEGTLVDEITRLLANAKAGKDKGWTCPREDVDNIVNRAPRTL